LGPVHSGAVMRPGVSSLPALVDYEQHAAGGGGAAMTVTDSPRFNDHPDGCAAKSFGEALRKVREATGTTMKRLAHETAYSSSHLRSVENGNRKATHDLVAACDDALRAGGVLVTLAHAEATDDQVRRRAVLAALGTLTAIGMPDPRLVSEALRSDLLSVLG
jgi:transcriptional regulator with XRE-family HTH domain